MHANQPRKHINLLAIGDDIVPADDDLIAVKHTCDALMQATRQHHTDVTAVVSRNYKSVTVATAEPNQVLTDTALLVEHCAGVFNKHAREVADTIVDTLERTSDGKQE